MEFAYPFHLHGHGREAHAHYADHVRQMIEQLLFTAPGERVNRPDFGCGLLQLVFGTLGEVMDATTQAMVQSALQRWLGSVIQVEAVQVVSHDSTMQITVQYVLRQTQERQVAQFSR